MVALSQIRSVLLASVVAVFCVLSSSPATAAPTFYSTGTHVSAGLDQDWLVSTGYGSFNTSSFVQAHSWPHGSEIWITDAQTQQYQYLTFRQEFDLSGYDAANATLKFCWGGDDVPSGWSVIAPVFSVNNGAFQGAGTATGYSIGSNVVTIDSGFVAGLNHIDFRVQGNYATNGMGLRVESFTAPTVPEPQSCALLLGGLAPLGFMAARRKRQVA